jgi:methylated-DNA-[protein]-cysteine S-methyltransferase
VGAWTKTASPFGPLWIVATERGIAAVGLRDGSRVLGEASRRLGGRLVQDGPDAPAGASWRLAEARDALAAAFAGRPAAVEELDLDLSGLPDFDRRILEATRRVPRGQVSSYGRVARLAGLARAARATGGALGRNPVWILVPCHRVVAADGTLGGYGGGLDALDVKRGLLAREGIELPARELFG